VIDKPMKFLGSEVTGTNTPSAMFASLLSKLKHKLENIDRSTLRGDINAIYIPSMPYPHLDSIFQSTIFTRHTKTS
jgi:hypothetical protein